MVLTPDIAFLASGDIDDDGVLDAEDNCPYISNELQLDEVSAFQLNRWHDGNATFPNPAIKQIPAVYKPVWVPADRSNVQIYLAGLLLQESTNYAWVDQGMAGIDYFNPVAKLKILPTTRAGKLTMVVLGDSDGSGNMCSTHLGRDFDGIPEPADNCPVDYNPYQQDTFGSLAQGDACEHSPASTSKTVQQKRDELAQAMYPYAYSASNSEIARVYAKTSQPDNPITQTYATLYTGNNYTGTAVTYRTDARSLVTTDIGDNTVSSIKVGPHTEVTLHKDANYSGATEQFYLDDTDLEDNGIGDNTASSLRLVSSAPIVVNAFEQKSEADKRTELAAAGYPYAATASKTEIALVYERTAIGYASSMLIELWSGAEGFVGHILPHELVQAVDTGKSSTVQLQSINRDNFKSVQLTYNGNGEYQIATTNLSGTISETAHFHYAGVPDTNE